MVRQNMVKWIIYFLILILNQRIVTSREGHRLNEQEYAADVPSSLPQKNSFWYKRLWESQPIQQKNFYQNNYREDPLYFLQRKQLKGDDELSSQEYLPVKEIETNDRGAIQSHSKIKTPEGHITVQVYKPSAVEDIEGEGKVDDFYKTHSVSNSDIIKEEKKSPTPVQQAEFSVTNSANNSPVAYHHKQLPNTEKKDESKGFSDVYFVAIVAGCSAVAIFGVVAAGYCFYKLQKSSKAAADVDYPAYGITGPSKETTSPNGDRKLAQSAQMYHYQHQKQQMIAVEKASSTHHASASDVDSEEENEEGDFTVYECPGLAPTGEMEVKNPLFNDDSTPVSPPANVTPKLLEK
ncbi:neural proliferation differentiation and control protein 1 isoform X1 [Centruroides vittatus]|uniref:neural proliferation differentiation and control protein 1 isoform X1 n=1 Tax=Centruroides vittatus TaxID=120091 RepID=UPI00350EAC4D